MPAALPLKPGRWVALLTGVLLVLFGLVLAWFGSGNLSRDYVPRDGDYLIGEVGTGHSDTYALVSPSFSQNFPELLPADPPVVGEDPGFRITMRPAEPGQDIFLGIAAADTVSDYLADVPHTELHPDSLFPGWWSFSPRLALMNPVERFPAGRAAPAPPAEQDFWIASVTGWATQELAWDLPPGNWSLVIMNTDASGSVTVELQVGVRDDGVEYVPNPIGFILLLLGIPPVLTGVLLVLFGATGLGRNIVERPERLGESSYPVHVRGAFPAGVSRWRWLFKWLLAFPHYLLLGFLGVASLITAAAAGIAILCTGRYPRAWFLFNVGVLRWFWRVGYYAYSALGTDRYPPFTLSPVDYPADLEVHYPERLARGPVLFKWLFSLPHVLLLVLLSWGVVFPRGGFAPATEEAALSVPVSVLGLLILFAALALAFTGRYPLGLFDFIVGLNRWTYRVGAYLLLLRDEYPPFRLELGGEEPKPMN